MLLWNLKVLIAWSIFVYACVLFMEEQSKEICKLVYENIQYFSIYQELSRRKYVNILCCVKNNKT